MAGQLIINADDFGSSRAVNAAVARARRHGFLTSASLMVTGAAAAEAVSMARDDPGLSVGLHIVLSDGTSCLPWESVPHVVCGDGTFRRNPAWAALRYYFDPRARREIEFEVESQFEAFAETGLPLSHVDGHQHLHAHPAVLPVVIEQAMRHGACGIRIPSEPFLETLRLDRSGIGAKCTMAAGHAYLERVSRRMLRGGGLASCDRSIGNLMSGRMSTDYVARMLERLKVGSVEFYFHPSEEPTSRFGPNPGDLCTLLDSELWRVVQEGGWELTNYAGVMRRKQEAGGGCFC